MKSTFFLLLGLLVLGSISLAQAQSPVEEDMPTRKVDKKVKENKRSNFPKEKKIRFIYVKKGKKVLYGNPCGIEATHKMSFEYGIEHRKEKGFLPWWRRLKNNTATKTFLFFTRGPWWKATINKRLKRCVQSSGDRRG